VTSELVMFRVRQLIEWRKKSSIQLRMWSLPRKTLKQQSSIRAKHAELVAVLICLQRFNISSKVRLSVHRIEAKPLRNENGKGTMGCWFGMGLSWDYCGV